MKICAYDDDATIDILGTLLAARVSPSPPNHGNPYWPHFSGPQVWPLISTIMRNYWPQLKVWLRAEP